MCGLLFTLSPAASPWFPFLAACGLGPHIPQLCPSLPIGARHQDPRSPCPTGKNVFYPCKTKIMLTIPLELNATCKQKEVAGRTEDRSRCRRVTDRKTSQREWGGDQENRWRLNSDFQKLQCIIILSLNSAERATQAILRSLSHQAPLQGHSPSALASFLSPTTPPPFSHLFELT